MKLIVAVNNKNYIGKNGQLMWRCSADLKHFKERTSRGTLIMGSTTWELCLLMKALPDRAHIVIGQNYKPTLFEGLKRAVEVSSTFGSGDIWVIGGASIYNQLIHLCSEIHISHIDDDQEGDTTFFIPSGYRGQVFNYYFSPNGKQTTDTV